MSSAKRGILDENVGEEGPYSQHQYLQIWGGESGTFHRPEEITGTYEGESRSGEIKKGGVKLFDRGGVP